MNEKVKRIITSIFYFILVMSIVIINKYEYTVSIVLLESLICIYEYFNAVDLKKSFFKYLGYIISIAYFLFGILFKNSQIYLKEIIIVSFLISAMYTVLKYKKVDFKEIFISNFAYLYIPFSLSFISEMFNMQNGNILYLFLMFTVMGTDSGAYIIGSKIGKNKLTKLSPKKSIEGSIGGIISAMVFVLITHLVIKSKLNIYILMLITFILSIISQFGDLLASYIKRHFGKKDYGSILIGHGGMLDRIDSLILSAPIAYILFQIFF